MSAPSLTDFLLARIAEDEATPDDLWDTSAEEDMAAQIRRDAQAKRRIVTLHRLAEGPTYRGTPCCARCTADGEYPADDGYADEQNWPCPTLRALALPYADHPDYREEWKP